MMGLKHSDPWSFSISSRTSRCSATWSQLRGGHAAPTLESGAGCQGTGPGHATGWGAAWAWWLGPRPVALSLCDLGQAPLSLGLGLPIPKMERGRLIRSEVSKFDFGWKAYFFSNNIRSRSLIPQQVKVELLCLKWEWGSETCPYAIRSTSLTPNHNTCVCAHTLAYMYMSTRSHVNTHLNVCTWAQAHTWTHCHTCTREHTHLHIHSSGL